MSMVPIGAGPFGPRFACHGNTWYVLGGGKAIQKITEPVTESGRRYRGFNFFSKNDGLLLEAIAREEFIITGLWNRDLQRYRCLDLMWRPAGRIVRFVIVRHPHRGTIFLLFTDLTLEPLEILQLYGYRFKIELGFRQAVRVLGSYAYHFWMEAPKR